MFRIFLVGVATGFSFNGINAPQLSGKTLFYTPTGAPFFLPFSHLNWRQNVAYSKRSTPDESISRADVGSRSGLQPLSWPVSSGSMFTGLAQAASWKEIKASERTTDSSLITTSLSFTNTSGTNYALYCLQAGEGASPESSLMSSGDCLSNLFFSFDA